MNQLADSLSNGAGYWLLVWVFYGTGMEPTASCISMCCSKPALLPALGLNNDKLLVSLNYQLVSESLLIKRSLIGVSGAIV